IDVKQKVKPYLDLQLVAFPQDGYLRSPNAARNLDRALDLGVDVVGGIPHFARATGSHLTSMHSMDNYYVSKLLPLIAESGMNAIANPLINLTLQGRHDTYPRRRGMTRVAEMRALGIPVALGQDCVMDPWYSLGGADMLDVAHMALHGAPMTSREAIRWTFDAVTEIPARIL